MNSFVSLALRLGVSLARSGVITFARLYFETVLRFDFHFAETAIVFIVRRRISDAVLTPQFGCNLVKCLFQFVSIVAHVDHSSAGLIA